MPQRIHRIIPIPAVSGAEDKKEGCKYDYIKEECPIAKIPYVLLHLGDIIYRMNRTKTNIQAQSPSPRNLK
jgi:hypothetical protein